MNFLWLLLLVVFLPVVVGALLLMVLLLVLTWLFMLQGIASLFRWARRRPA